MLTNFDGFKGRAKRLDPGDYSRIGSMIRVGEDEMRAFVEVESSGAGFAPDGRPLILNEPHVFFRSLPKAKRDKAVKQGLAYAKWGDKPYIKSQSARYDWLERAIAIDETAALKSCSWGLTQLLGENYAAAGYESVQHLVASFMDDEENHLLAAANFISHEGLDDELRGHRWEAFARGYNGPGFRKHKYHTRLAAAYAKWSGRPNAGTGGLPAWEVKAIQQRLRDLGWYSVGKVDGMWGPATTGAIASFQASEGLTVNGLYDDATRRAMQTAPKREVSLARETTTVDDLRKQGSQIVTEQDDVKTTSSVVGGAGVVAATVGVVTEHFESAWSMLLPIREAFDSVPLWAWGLMAAGLAYYYHYKANKTQEVRLVAERIGLHNGEPDPAPTPPLREPPDTPRV
jgi:hypothetical protein